MRHKISNNRSLINQISGLVDSDDLSDNSIGDLKDVDTTTTAPLNNQVLSWNGTNWVPQTVAVGGSTIYTADGTLAGNRNIIFNNHNLAFDTDKLFVNGSSGKIGLGTITPLFKLDVDGDIKLKKNLYLTDSNFQNGFSVNSRSGHGYDYLQFHPIINGVDHYDRGITIRSDNGNVGIGTTSPGSPLNVKKAIANIYETTIENTDPNGWGLSVRTTNNDNNKYAFSIYDNADTERDFVITNAGNVGIGVDTPTNKFQVGGDFRLNGAFKDKDGDVGTAGQILSSTVAGTDWIGAPTSASASIDTHSDVDTTTNAPLNNQVLAWDGSNWVPAANQSGNLYTSDDALAGNRNVTFNNHNLAFDTNKFFIDGSNGNVGIGTALLCQCWI